MRKLVLSLAMLVGMLCSAASADQITMKNGDRLTGTIVKFDGERLTIKSEFAGEVQIPWAAIEKITSDQPVYVALKDGRRLIGTLTTTEKGIEVQASQAETVALSRESIQLIRSKDEQAAYEAELARQREARWSGSADAGISATRGNSDTLVISLGTQAARATQKGKLSLYAAALLARNSTTGVSVTTAEAIRGGARYDRDISARLFGFGLIDLEHDKFQQLDLRLVPGGGLGFHARKSDRTRLDLFGGGSFNREKFSTGLTRSSAEALFG